MVKGKIPIISDILEMNKILKLLTISDIFVLTGFGLISPILAIFIKDNLAGGTILAAGIASAIFLITKSVLQILFAYIFNPKDRLWMLLAGTALIAAVPFGYIFSMNIWHIFIIQFVYGIGASFAYPSWLSLFTSNLKKGARGFQFSVYSSSVGISTAVAAYFGAQLAELTNFIVVFAITGILSITGLLILFTLEKKQIMRRI